MAYQRPVDTLEPLTGDPSQDMSNVSDVLQGMGADFNLFNVAFGTGGADPTGQTDSTQAFLDAIAFLPTSPLAGGKLRVPPGKYLVNLGSLTPVNGMKLEGDGWNCTRIITTANHLFNCDPGSPIDTVEISGISLEATGFDIFHGANCTRWNVHDCRLVQNSAGNSIWEALTATTFIENSFWNNEEQVFGATRTKPAWEIVVGGTSCNQNIWRDEKVFNENGDSAEYLWRVATTATGSRDNRWKNISVEHPNGGIIHTESLQGTVIEDVTCWDPNNAAFPLIWIDQNATALVAPAHTTIKNLARHSGPEIGTADIKLHSSCTQTIIDGISADGAVQAPIIDAGGSSLLTLINMPASYTLNNPGTFGNINGSPVGGGSSFLCAPVEYAPGTLATLTATSLTFAALDSTHLQTGSFTAPASGTVIVAASFIAECSASGVAMAYALAAHGTVTPLVANAPQAADSSVTAPRLTTVKFRVTGLTPGNSYNFDLLAAVGSAAQTLSVLALGLTATTITAGTRGGPVLITVEGV